MVGGVTNSSTDVGADRRVPAGSATASISARTTAQDAQSAASEAFSQGREIASTVGSGAETAYNAADWLQQNSIGRVKNFTGPAVRSGVDSLGSMGSASRRWNYRQWYRDQENSGQRAGAALGNTMGIVLPGILAQVWRKTGWAVPGSGHGVAAGVMRVGGGAWLAGAAGVSAYKAFGDTVDEGNLKVPLGTAAGLGALYGVQHVTSGVHWLPGRIGLVGAATAAAAGGGYLAGRELSIGSGHLGEDHPETTLRFDRELRPVAYARGFWNHFAEEGPLTQGASFGKAWKQRESYNNDYNNTERFGGMTGDLAALGLSGASSLAIINTIVGKDPGALLRNPIIRASNNISIPSKIVSFIKSPRHADEILDGMGDEEVRRLTRETLKGPKAGTPLQVDVLNYLGKQIRKRGGRAPWYVHGAGVGLLAYTVIDAYKNGEGGKAPLLNGPQAAAATGAGLLAGAWAINRYAPFAQNYPARARGVMSLVTSAALGAGIFTARGSFESFVADARDNFRHHDFRFGLPQAGVVGAGIAGGSLLSAYTMNLLSVTGRARGAGFMLGGLAGAGVGFSFVPALS